VKALIPLLAGIVVTGCRETEELQDAAVETGLEIQVITSYHGRVALDLTDQASVLSEVIIRSQADYEGFLTKIPKRQITRTKPAPPSEDPLLKQPSIDFDNSMMLVAIRSDSMYVAPEFKSITCDKNGLSVRIADPELGDTKALNQQEGIGTYQAVIIPHREGLITFIR
tara:strand:- start:7338 stop:7844 length:507 start_codon:yes stop_codon:yes gene_type:complete